MHVEAINIGTSDALGPVDSVHAVAGRGLEGDRYFFPDGAGGMGRPARTASTTAGASAARYSSP